MARASQRHVFYARSACLEQEQPASDQRISRGGDIIEQQNLAPLNNLRVLDPDRAQMPRYAATSAGRKFGNVPEPDQARGGIYSTLSRECLCQLVNSGNASRGVM